MSAARRFPRTATHAHMTSSLDALHNPIQRAASNAHLEVSTSRTRGKTTVQHDRVVSLANPASEGASNSSGSGSREGNKKRRGTFILGTKGSSGGDDDGSAAKFIREHRTKQQHDKLIDREDRPGHHTASPKHSGSSSGAKRSRPRSSKTSLASTPHRGGMATTLAERMLRLVSRARTKVMIHGLNESLSKTSTIVAVRMRPHNKKEKALDKRSVFSSTAEPVFESNTVCRVGKRAFTFDAVIGPSLTQGDVFKLTAKQVLGKVLSGFNGTVMAYGQTGSGKTYTMQGSAEQPGVIPRICANIFLAVHEDRETDFDIKCSYVEIYNENLHDLLTKEQTSPIIVEHPTKGITLKNVIDVTVRSQMDVQDLFDRGASQRAVGFTEMNAESSRSHAVFTIYVKSQHKNDTEGLTKKVSKFHLIDLAGSERADRTGASGTRLKEGAAINQSLSALGNVINALTKSSHKQGNSREPSGSDSGDSPKKSDRKSNKHVPYRSSKLTRLLQDSLGGNSYTMLICNISPAKSSIAETLSSLRFAERAKQVQNKATVNQDPKALARLRLMKENTRLLAMVHSLRSQLQAAGVSPVPIVSGPGQMHGAQASGHAPHAAPLRSVTVPPGGSTTTLSHAEGGGVPALPLAMDAVAAPPTVHTLRATGSVPNMNSEPVTGGGRASLSMPSYDPVLDAETDASLVALTQEGAVLHAKLEKLAKGRHRVAQMRARVAANRKELQREQEQLDEELAAMAEMEKDLAELDEKAAAIRRLAHERDLTEPSHLSGHSRFSSHSEVGDDSRSHDEAAQTLFTKLHEKRAAAMQAGDAIALSNKIHIDELRVSVQGLVRRKSMDSLGERVRIGQSSRIAQALEQVNPDAGGFVDYDEFIAALGLSRPRSVTPSSFDGPASPGGAGDVEETAASDGLGRREHTLSSGKVSPATLEREAHVDDVIGHHKVIVGTHADMSARNLANVVDQLESVEALLDGIDGMDFDNYDDDKDEHGDDYNVGTTGFSLDHLTGDGGLDQLFAGAASLSLAGLQGHEHQDHDDPEVQAQRASEIEAKAIKDKSFTNKIHSAIRWNRSRDKWMALLDSRDDAKSMPDLVNGNYPIHIAAQVR